MVIISVVRHEKCTLQHNFYYTAQMEIILDSSSIMPDHAWVYLSYTYLGQVQIIIFGATLV